MPGTDARVLGLSSRTRNRRVAARAGVPVVDAAERGREVGSGAVHGPSRRTHRAGALSAARSSRIRSTGARRPRRPRHFDRNSKEERGLDNSRPNRKEDRWLGLASLQSADQPAGELRDAVGGPVGLTRLAADALGRPRRRGAGSHAWLRRLHRRRHPVSALVGARRCRRRDGACDAHRVGGRRAARYDRRSGRRMSPSSSA